MQNLPVDVLKIDKSFIDRINDGGAGAAMVRSVIELGRALGLTSIAEGVEGRDQLAALDELGCDSAQGFLMAEPLAGPDFARALGGLPRHASWLPGPTPVLATVGEPKMRP